LCWSHLSLWAWKKDTTDTDVSTSYLDLHLGIDSDGRLRTKLYDKRYDFNIPIVNFRYIRSTFPAAAYGVYICQMIRYSRTVAPIRMSLIEDVDNTEAIETMVPFGNDGVITSNMWRSPPWLGWQLWTICVNNNDHRYVPLIESTSQALPHSRLIIGW
jgi:hypothetical protein